MLEKFLNNNNLQDEQDIDALLELAEIVRQLVADRDYDGINKAVVYTIEQGYYEAFLWTMGILQEEFEKENCCLQDFDCFIGGKINNYDSFMEKLQTEPAAARNDMEKVYDKNGEVESFFNIFVYRTGFENVYLVSAENFDTKDNDFIQYRLSFTKSRI